MVLLAKYTNELRAIFSEPGFYYNQQWQKNVQLCFNHKSSSSMLHPQAKVFGSVPERHGPFVD